MGKQPYFAFPAIWVPLTWPKPVFKTKDHSEKKYIGKHQWPVP